MIGVLVKMIICGILLRECECNKAHKITDYLDIKNCLCQKRLFGKLVLVCEDEMCSTSENSFDGEKIA